MEVSRKLSIADKQVGIETQEADNSLEGGQLIDTLVTLTGLPEPVAHDELDQILALTGRDGVRADLTLDELRQALLIYLESFQPEGQSTEPWVEDFDA
jgi:hypothetical protein